ncbi:MAG: hypothetical protein Q7S69_00185 [Nitrosomonadaceae bacterium]|nr:hypothetical protein [Nitrosomonadaceae bacterium]
MATDSAYSVSTTGSQVNSTQKSAEDCVVGKQEVDKDKGRSSNTGASSEVHNATPTVLILTVRKPAPPSAPKPEPDNIRNQGSNAPLVVFIGAIKKLGV